MDSMGLGGCVLTCTGRSLSSPPATDRSTVSRAALHPHFIKLLCSEIKLCLRGLNALSVGMPVCIRALK